jgi:carboxyl-terminal processing protease
MPTRDKRSGLKDPAANFDALWRMFDRNYGSFIPKRVDWDLLYRVYRPKVRPRTNDRDLFELMSRLLELLNDNHVKIQSRQPPRFFRSGILGQLNRDARGRHIPIGYNIPDFSLDLVKRGYLQGHYEERLPGTRLAAYFGGDFPLYTFGRLKKDIGYFHIRNFDEAEKTAAIADEIVTRFRKVRGLIVDIRGNGGGWDPVAKAIADRFADTRRLYMVTRTRNGPRHDDFTPPRYWYIEPRGSRPFSKPIVLLTHRWSISAADCFALAMRTLPHVTNLGEFTSGAYSDEYWDTLPNGWEVSIANKLYLDADGRCWEGIGTPPDIRLVNTREDIAAGRDRVLETAVELLMAGLARRHEAKPAPRPRESLAESLEKAIRSVGVSKAVDLFNRAKHRDPGTFYVDREEMDTLAKSLLSQEKVDEALEVLTLNRREFPRDYHVHQGLAEAFEKKGDDRLARSHYRKAAELNPKNLPEEKRDSEKALEIVNR